MESGASPWRCASGDGYGCCCGAVGVTAEVGACITGTVNGAGASGIASVAWETPAINALIKETVTKHGLKMPKLAMPLRVILTGQAQTPSVDAVIALIGREGVLTALSRNS